MHTYNMVLKTNKSFAKPQKIGHKGHGFKGEDLISRVQKLEVSSGILLLYREHLSPFVCKDAFVCKDDVIRGSPRP